MEIETVSINDDGSQTLSVPSPVQTEPGASDKDASRDDDDVSLPESVNSEIENDMTSCCKQTVRHKISKRRDPDLQNAMGGRQPGQKTDPRSQI